MEDNKDPRKEMDKAEYWKQRCLLAEKAWLASPCDPDITEKQIKAHDAHSVFINTYIFK